MAGDAPRPTFADGGFAGADVAWTGRGSDVVMAQRVVGSPPGPEE
jgi:hypothetical protein